MYAEEAQVKQKTSNPIHNYPTSATREEVHK